MAIDLNFLIPAVLSIGCWTIIFKDNPLYRICEYTAVGLGPAYLLVTNMNTLQQRAIVPALTKGDFIAIFGTILGAMILLRLFKPIRLLANPPMAMLVGTGTGLTMAGYLEAQFGQQIAFTTSSMIGATPWDTFKSVLITIMTVSTIAYFVFTRKQAGSWGYLTKFGRYTLMAAWGASYASFTTTRLNSLIGQLQVILYNFLGIVA